MFIGPQLSLQRPEKMRFRMQMYSILYSFRNSLSVVGDGTKTPTEDDTINQISAETYSQRQHKE